MRLFELNQAIPSQVYEPAPRSSFRVSQATSKRAISASVLVWTDLMLVWLGAAVTLWLYNELSTITDEALLRMHIASVALLSLIIVLTCHAQGLYRRPWEKPAASNAIAVLISVSCAAGFVQTLIHLFPQDAGLRFPMYAAEIAAAALLIARNQLTRRRPAPTRRARAKARRILMLGDNTSARKLEEYLSRTDTSGYVIVGRHSTADPSATAESPLYLGSQVDIRALREMLRSHFVDELLITLPEDREVFEATLKAAEDLNISVGVIPDWYGVVPAGVPLEYLGPCPVLRVNQEKPPRFASYVKRCVDILSATLLLLACLPILLLLSALISIDSPGPVIYAAERVGRKGRRFRCYKLRTMVRDAETLRESLQVKNDRDSILFKVKNDPRVTRVGRFLRRYSLDELPQLWNVLKGDMSLIGPRPSLPEEVAQYKIEHLRRLDVSPGITGLWQICARRDPSFSTYIRLDNEYVANWSLWLDCKIFLKTILVVLAGTGE